MGAAHEGEVDELTAGTARLRALARALVGDAHAAEDLVQDAWVAALERGRPAGEVPGGWLAGVLRKLALHRARSERHRADRELAHARSSREEPDPDERLDSVEQLVAAVRALDEPYKTAILLRYFEDLRPVEIAARLGVPVRTVHTRLARALVELRERLDRRHGDRGAWMALFAPLAKAPNALLAGGWIVQTKSKIALAVVLVLCAGAAWFAAGRGEHAVDLRALAPSGEPVASAGPRDGVGSSSAAAGERSALAAPPLAPRPPAAAPARIRGIVIGLDDLPLADQHVVFVDESSHGPLTGFDSVSDVQGRFDLPHPGRRGVLDLAGSSFVTVLQPVMLDPPENVEHVLVAAPRSPLAGVVVDPDDNPIEGAELELIPLGLTSSVLRILDRCRDVRLRARSGSDGRFAMPEAPLLAEAMIHTRCPKFQEGSDALADGARSDLVIRLERRPRIGRWISGRVVDADGRPVVGAHVGWMPQMGFQVATTDEKGLFALPWMQERAAPHPSIQAIGTGFLPVTIDSFPSSLEAAPEFPEPLILRLEAPAPSIKGRVLDGDGAPVVGAEIRIFSQTNFGLLIAEDGGRFKSSGTTIESLIKGSAFDSDHVDHTDSNGNFETRGLLNKRYSVHCFDPRTCAEVRMESVPAGSRDLELRMPRVEPHHLIAGKVVDHSGRPIPLAGVRLVSWYEDHDGDGALQSTGALLGSRVTTDSDGCFEFRDIARDVKRISVSTPDGDLKRSFQLEELPDLQAARLEIPRACHVQIDLRDSSLDATFARLIDSRGEPCEIMIRSVDKSSPNTLAGLRAGRTPAFIAPDDGAAIVLYRVREGQEQPTELARIPVHLKAGELNVIRP